MTGESSREWNGYQIRTSHEYPPIPTGAWDWVAWLDGWEEGPSGSGPTEEQALADLRQQLSEIETTDPQSIRRRR